MKLLLDTQIALWFITGNPRLTASAPGLISAIENDLYVSAITVWEVAIKYPLQRGSPNDMPICGREALNLFEEAGLTLLPVTAAHAAAIDDLPPLHADPFDRMLIAQARTEPMHLLTADRRLAVYGAPVMVV